MSVVLWSKPGCVQCRAVRWRLEAAGIPFEERDLSLPAHVKDLAHFRGLGFSTAPITEYGGIAVPGFMPSEIDRVIAAWRADHQEGGAE